MRTLAIVVSLSFTLLLSGSAVAGEDGDCPRGPYEMRLPANVNCCGWSAPPFCLWECTIWVNNPADVGPDVCTTIGSASERSG